MAYVKPSIKNAVLAFSKNTCAYPGCHNKIINKNGTMIGNICHIEAKEENGPRFNKNQADDERNGFDNLICLCYEHHQITHDLNYSVDDLKKMKYDAENDYKSNLDIINSSQIYEMNLDNEKFKEKTHKKYNNFDSFGDLKAPLNIYENFDSLTGEVKEMIDYIDHVSIELIEFLDNLNDNIIKHLKKIQYDTKKWEQQKYTDNPFVFPLWEETHIGLGNSINLTRYRMLQIEYLFYEEYLKTHQEDSLSKIKFNNLKQEILKSIEILGILD